jgi:hypothetical protein
MRPVRTDRGTLIVPRRVDLVVDGKPVHGDGTEEIDPDHPDFEQGERVVEQLEAPDPGTLAPYGRRMVPATTTQTRGGRMAKMGLTAVALAP